MIGPNAMIQRVADEAIPPTVYGRLHLEDEDDDVMLHDFVETEAILPMDLKVWFLSLYMYDRDDYEGMSYPVKDDLRKFAAMDPVVDLDTTTWSNPLLV